MSPSPRLRARSASGHAPVVMPQLHGLGRYQTVGRRRAQRRTIRRSNLGLGLQRLTAARWRQRQAQAPHVVVDEPTHEAHQFPAGRPWIASVASTNRSASYQPPMPLDRRVDAARVSMPHSARSRLPPTPSGPSKASRGNAAAAAAGSTRRRARLPPLPPRQLSSRRAGPSARGPTCAAASRPCVRRPWSSPAAGRAMVMPTSRTPRIANRRITHPPHPMTLPSLARTSRGRNGGRLPALGAPRPRRWDGPSDPAR